MNDLNFMFNSASAGVKQIREKIAQQR
jgi:hypothetical protein